MQESCLKLVLRSTYVRPGYECRALNFFLFKIYLDRKGHGEGSDRSAETLLLSYCTRIEIRVKGLRNAIST